MRHIENKQQNDRQKSNYIKIPLSMNALKTPIKRHESIISQENARFNYMIHTTDIVYI